MELDAILNNDTSNSGSSHDSNQNTPTSLARADLEPPSLRNRPYSSIYTRIKQQLNMPRPKKTIVGGGPSPKRMLTSKGGLKKRGTHGVRRELTLTFKQGKTMRRAGTQEDKLREEAAEGNFGLEGAGNALVNEEQIPEEVIPHFTPINQPIEGHPVEFTPINTPVSSQSKRSSSTISELSDIPAEIETLFREEEEKSKPKPRRGAARLVTKPEPIELILHTVDGLHLAPETSKEKKPLPRRRAARVVRVKTEQIEPVVFVEPVEPLNPLESTESTLPPPTSTPTKRKATTAPPSTISRAKKPKNQLGISPFPLHSHPTVEEVRQIASLLRTHHGPAVRPQILQPSLTVTGCGEVPLVFDALIRTVISANTSAANSAAALSGIIAAYGSKDGTIDYDAIHERSVEDLQQAMRPGGLAGIKSKNIKAILDEVSTKNIKAGRTGPIILSLEHLRPLSTLEVMATLMSYRGVGVKIAACVVLFCLQRPCLAIDTHCYRMARFLNWVPEGASADETFYHLDAVVPDEHKYELHELFMKHGQTCGKCNRENSASESARKRRAKVKVKVKVKKGSVKQEIERVEEETKGEMKKEEEDEEKEEEEEEEEYVKDEGCVLEEYVTRVWKKKGVKKENVEKVEKVEGRLKLPVSTVD